MAAEMLHKPKVGDLAYPCYRPQQAGVIVAIDVPIHWEAGTSLGTRPGVRIRMINGREVETATPMSLLTLVEEHRRKYRKFDTLATALATMAVADGIRPGGPPL
jgi:hypothetical protein